VPPEFLAFIEQLWKTDSENEAVGRLALRIGLTEARQRVVAVATDAQAAESRRVEMLEILADLGSDSLIDPLLELLVDDQPASIRLATLNTLSRYDAPGIAATLIDKYPAWSEELQA